ncbi:MAG: lysophospholipid acyltransferase family protein [Clostridia bacterium]|jgi:1-acyl-sn-glycerol-3-phosphate acyltransferase
MLYRFIRCIFRPLVFILFRPTLIGYENLQIQGKCIIICNHISLLDPVIIGCIVPRPIHFMAKKGLFRNRLFGWLLSQLGAFPVKRGTADIAAIKKALKVLKDGELFGIFPEGTRSKTGDMQELEPGVAMIALKSDAPVVPIYIHNRYRCFKKTLVTIGKPIDLSNYKGQKMNNDVILEVTNHLSSALKSLMTK